MNLVNFLSIYGLSMRSRELTLDAFCGARPSVFSKRVVKKALTEKSHYALLAHHPDIRLENGDCVTP